MIITVVNRSKTIADEKVLNVVRAINRQIKEDFEPYWSLGATLRLEGAVGGQPDKLKLPEMRGDAILYLSDKTDVADALGYHEANCRGIPYGFVFTDLCKKLNENWTVTLSHEALELIGDAQGNLLVQGPHPSNPNKEVFHWFEMCDAVQSQFYLIDGVEVSNFVLPLYFTIEEQEGGRNDFLGQLTKGKGLCSFGVSKDSYIGYYDPQTGAHETYNAPNDKIAAQRAKLKADNKVGRGYVRKHGDATRPKEKSQNKALRHTVAQAADKNDPIRHVVVLMMENRSFDHLLGDATKIYPNLEGIPQNGGKYSNFSTSGKEYKQQNDATAKLNKDLPHEHEDVMQQLGEHTSKPMGGFVDTYIQSVKPVKLDENNKSDRDQIQQVMSYFPFGDTTAQDSLPALHKLAREFLICDHWFSSMPGPTWQNRFFIHSGTCKGHVLMPSRKQPQNMRLYDQDTVYDRLNDADKKWRIYHDGMPQSIVMSHMWLKYGVSLLTDSYAPMKNFYQDVKGDANDFPEYVFIEPGYFSPDENDQHPPSDIAGGDKLIADVYNALRNNEELWKSTLLIITYDEHGGFYDHVPPPATVAPDENVTEYNFARLGVRVPTILVSPWVKKGVCKTVFDHTSVLRYVCDKWSMPGLSKRMDASAGIYQANSFATEILSKPRPDTPKEIPHCAIAPIPRGRRAAVAPPLDGAREALLYFLATLPKDTLEPGLRAARKIDPKAAAKLRKLDDDGLRKLAEQRFENLIAPKELQRTAGRILKPAKPVVKKAAGEKPGKGKTS